MAGPPMRQPPSVTGAPTAASLWRWVVWVLALHGAFFLAMLDAPIWQIEGPQSVRVGPVQTRWVTPEPMAPQAVPASTPAPARKTRVATVTQAAEAPDKPLTPLPLSAEPQPAPSPVLAETKTAVAEAPTPAGEAPTPVVEAPTPVAEANAGAAPTIVAPTSDTLSSDRPELAQAQPARTPTPQPATDGLAEATMAMPPLGLAALPASALLSYRLTGQEKGMPYQATGELRWQRNAGAYAMALSVKAFLLGARHWRSQGLITSQGLAPVRFSDSWRSERAAHFDRTQNRIVFSSNAPVAPLQAGAQDQISLYAQVAALMAHEGGRLPPGTRLQVQTATVRDALPWMLTLEQAETLQLDGRPLTATKWVCLPRNRFDAKVEFWVAAAHDWLPVRIRITQLSGNYIDLVLTAREALPELPLSPTPG